MAQPSTGNFWVLHNWAPGAGGNTTDSYRIFYDNSWHNVTGTSFNHTNLDPHSTSTIRIVAYNTSTSTTSSEVTSTAQLTNNPIAITSVPSSVPITLGETVSIAAGHNDEDGDTPTFSCSDTDKFSNFNTATGEGSWTPESTGTYPVTFGVSDGHGSSDTVATVITVTRNDLPPVLTPIGDKSVDEGTFLRITVSATDPDNDDDDITYSVKNLPSGATFDSDDAYFRWRPGSGTEGDYEVEFVATSNGLTDSETITITVIGPDDAPVITQIDDQEATVNHPLTFTVSATDDDNNDDAITYSAENLPSGANIDADTGEFSWTPVSTGVFNINFIATSNGLEDTEEVTITVNADSAPELTLIGDKQGNETELLTFTVSANDDDGDDPTYSANNLPVGASINSDTGEFSWTPGYEAAGTYDVEFVATTYELTDSETITITINNVDRAPVLDSIGNKAVAENETLTFTISATDPDDSNAVITYSGSNLPEGSTLDSTTGLFSWTPDFDAEGSYGNVEFIATSNSLNDNENITITVGNYNRPPELSSIGSKTVEEGNNLKITLSATDPDSVDNLTYSSQNLPGNSTFNASTAVFSWTPEDGDVGTYYALFSVSDGEFEDSENVTITVTEPSTSSGGGSSSSSSGGGGGGGAAVSSEKYENIVLKDYVLKTSVLRDDDVVFAFEKPENSITSVSFTPNVNGGKSKAVVEMLQETSSQVNSDAPGDVYKNMNIYLDTALVSAAIEDIKISFEVKKSWVSQNNINISHIVLCRYTSSEWELLPTEMTEEDSEYLYFTSETPGFSSFAISSVDPASLVEPVPKSTITIPQSDEGILASTVDSLEELGPSQKSVSAFGFVLILIIAGLGIIYWAVKME